MSTHSANVLGNDKFGAIGGEVIRVDVTLWRRGNKEDTERLGWMEITNVGPTSEAEERDRRGERFYQYRMHTGWGVTSGTVRHRRQDSVYDLIVKAIRPELQDWCPHCSTHSHDGEPCPEWAL